MADFAGVVQTNLDLIETPFEFPGRTDAAYTHPVPTIQAIVDDPESYAADVDLNGVWTMGDASMGANANNWGGYVDDRAHGLEIWWESFHILPRRHDLGNILTTQVINFEIYSAYRTATQSWNGFVNNAGTGVSIDISPTQVFPPLTGLDGVLTVTTDGPPVVASDLVFSFDVPQTISVPITLTRLVLFPFQPNKPYTETLAFSTDILKFMSGKEQRVAVRAFPRSIFEWEFFFEDGVERATLHNKLFGSLVETFGIPIWHEMTQLTAEGSSGASTITVASTDYADYRAGSLVAIWTDYQTFDVHEIDSFTSTTITIDSTLSQTFPVGAKVMPVRLAVIDGVPQGRRFPTADGTVQLRFRTLDNDANIADTSAFSTFNSKVLLDGCNVVQRELQESYTQDINVLDSVSGDTYQSSTEPNSRRQHGLGISCRTRQSLWEHRQLLHSLRGPQTSFYVPTYSEDLTPIANLTSGTNTLVISNVGYTDEINAVQPRDFIRVVFNDGTASITRQILSVVEDSATQETLTLDDTWASTYTADQIDRVEHLAEVRIATDDVRIRHRGVAVPALIQTSVLEVLE